MFAATPQSYIAAPLSNACIPSSVAFSVYDSKVILSDFKVNVNITPIPTTDPETIEVEYKPVIDANPYIRSKVLIEVSGRSMQESMIYEESPSFEQLIEKLADLNRRINKLQY